MSLTFTIIYFCIYYLCAVLNFLIPASSSQECTPLASCLWPLSSTLTTRFVCQLNCKTSEIFSLAKICMLKIKTKQTSSLLPCLFTFYCGIAEVCESPAGDSVDVQGEYFSSSFTSSISRFHLCCVFVLKRSSSVSYPLSSPTGSQHADFRSVLLCLLFFLLWILLFLASTFLLQR